MVQEWCDEVLFATYKVYTKQTDEGFDRKRSQGIGTGERIIRTVGAPGPRGEEPPQPPRRAAARLERLRPVPDQRKLAQAGKSKGAK